MPSTITLATVQADLALWLNAKTAAAQGQSFSLNGRTLSRQDIKEIRITIAELSRQERNLLDAARTGKNNGRLGFSVVRFS